MSKKTEKKNRNIFKAIRVKDETKKVVDSFLKDINSKKESGKITHDILLNFLIQNVTKEEIECLKLTNLTWEIEGSRIRQLYEKENNKVSDNMWMQFIQTDEYRGFAKLHSRLPLPWEQPLEMFTSKSRKKNLTKNNNNVILEAESA